MKQKITFNSRDLLNKYCKEDTQFAYTQNKNKLLMKRIKGNKTEFNFPKKIQISPSVVGLIVGEGHINQTSFIFANSNEKVIKRILDFISQFELSPKFILEISTKNVNTKFIAKSKKEWEKVLNKQIKKIRIRKEFNNTTNKGTLHVIYHNSCFARILNTIFKHIKQTIELNKNYIKEYLKGVIAAEGNINVKSTTTNCLYMVRISAKEKEEREHYKRCLEKLGIKIYCNDMPTINKNDPITKNWKTNKGRGGAVLINRWSNFYKIFSMDLLDLHKDKKEKFIKHFLYNKTTQLVLAFKNIPKKWFTSKELKDIFKSKHTPRYKINKMLSLNFLEKKKLQNKQAKYNYRLTNNFFNLINKLLNNAPFIE